MALRTQTIAIATLLMVAFSANAFAQTACTNGSAAGYPCSNIDLMAIVPLGDLRTGSTNDVWGWTDPSNGKEYALTGTRSGIVFVDITDPANPAVLGKLLTASGNSTWRDVKVYNNHAFVVSESDNHGMQVFDLTQLRGLSEDINRDFSHDARYRGNGNVVGDSHNIVINEDSGFAYIVGSDDCNGGLHMVDISDPDNPSFAGCFSADGYTHDAQCVIYNGPDTDHLGDEICVASNEDETTIVNVTNKNAPVELGSVVYPQTAYAHQGWFTEDHRYFIADDESDEQNIGFGATRTIVFDLFDLDNPEFAFFYFGPVNTSDHNLYVRGDYAFLSNYESGLRVVDISNIDSGTITEAGYFDTYPASNVPSFGGQWSNYPYFPSGTVIATDQDNGLFILKTTFPITTDTAGTELPQDAQFALSEAYPNPFASSSRLDLVIAETQTVVVELLDVTGRRISELFAGPLVAGRNLNVSVEGNNLPAGLYLVRVTGESFSTTQRVSLIR